jgi:hypothetical protein
MATRVHRPLKLAAFNANGIGRQSYELSKQLRELYIHVTALRDERFFIPHEQLYRTGRFLGIKGAYATAIRNDIPHPHM